MKALILQVDSEPNAIKAVRSCLDPKRYELVEAHSVLEALYEINYSHPVLALLEGFDALRAIRNKSIIPIIMLTSRTAQTDKYLAFELDVDDYVTKPFDPVEIAWRIRAVLRGNPQPRDFIHPVDDRLSTDFNHGELLVSGKRVSLTRTELGVLQYLVENTGFVVTAKSLLARAWGFDRIADHTALGQVIHNLRQKVEIDPINPQYILTAGAGLGYYFASQKPVKNQEESRSDD